MFKQKYWPVESAGTTQIHPELILWNEVKFRIEEYHEFNVNGVIRLHGKRLELDELTIQRMRNGKEITGYGLRELQPPALIQRSLWVLHNYPPDGHLRHIDTDEEGSIKIVALGLSTDEELASAKKAGPSSQELLKLVSRIYVGAQAVQARPAKAIQEAFNVSSATASNWVAKSKAEGYIVLGEDNG